MQKKTVLLTVNKAWNAFNFRRGVIKGLQSAGYRVVVAAPADGFESRLIEMGCEFRDLKMSRKGLNPLEDIVLFFRYLALCRDLRPVIVLGYTIKPNVYAGLVARVLKIPIVNNIAGLGTAFMKKGPLRVIATYLYRISLKSAHCVFFQNEDDLRLFRELGIVRAQNVIVLPGSGVDTEHFCPGSGRGIESKFRFLFVGRVLKDKGICELVEAVRQLRKFGLVEFELEIVGAVDEGNPSAISEQQLQEWAVEGLVLYRGATDDVRAFIDEADCVVLPSYREGTPRVILEAAAMERLSIVTDVPGCRDVVVEGLTGFKVRVKDPGALADAMRRVLDMSSLRRVEMGRAARKFVQEKYSESLVIDQYLRQVSAIS